MSFNFRQYLSFIFIFAILIGSYSLLIKPALALDCADPSYAKSNESYCREQLAKYLEEEANLKKQLETENKKSSNYASEVKRLTTEINALKTKIKSRENSIALLKNDINTKSSAINTLQSKIEREKDSLAQLIRKERQIDNVSIIALILSNDNISDIYGDIDSFNFIKEEIQKSVEKITGVKTLTEAEKKSLEDKKNQETDVKYELENTQKKTTQVESDKKVLLAGSINQAAALAKLAAEKKAQAEKIRSALIQFQGSGISSRSISFGEAYNYAKKASSKTGVRPALILAIMQQETTFGNNVGGCYVTQKPITGILKTIKNSQGKNITYTEYVPDGIYIQTGNPSRKTMIPNNFDNFLKITNNLSMNWEKTPISCAYMEKNYNGTPKLDVAGQPLLYGYGGAMGYTQFIPNTWILVEARVRNYLNISVANPWNAEHAVMATAVFLQDKGANSQTYTSEYNSACGYYGSCSSYASSVMTKATKIQLDINRLEDL